MCWASALEGPLSISQLLRTHTYLPIPVTDTTIINKLSLLYYPCLALPQLTPCLTPPCSPHPMYFQLPFSNTAFLALWAQTFIICFCCCFLFLFSLPYIQLFASASFQIWQSQTGTDVPSCLCSAGSGQGILSLHADLASLEMNDQMTPEARLC